MFITNISYPAYQLFLFTWIAIAIIIFFVLMRITAPYGRHASEKWGLAINNRMAWSLMEFPVLLMMAILILPFTDQISAPSWVMIGLFAFHYLNRTFIFPFRLHTQGKKMPLLVVAAGIFFNLVNGFSLGYYFAHFANYSIGWFMDIRFIIGIILFFLGMFINWKADDVLIHLRKPNETHYLIPKSWLFEYISCPNLFGELMEWLGFAILCWNLPALCFFIWTAANLIPRAKSHHKWYKEKFVDYPAKRMAIIPFLV